MDLEKLYADNYKNVYYVCLKFFRNEEDAEDMTQNIFIKAFDKINTLADINKFAPWIRQIANRECINELQRRGRFIVADENISNEEINLADDKQKNPEEIVVEDDVRDMMLEIIDKLPQDQRIAIYLFYYQDMTVKEISEVFNCPEQTTRSRLAYAKKNMKKEIEALEDKGIRIRAFSLLPFLYCIFEAEEKLVYADTLIPTYKAIGKGITILEQTNILEVTKMSEQINKPEQTTMPQQTSMPQQAAMSASTMPGAASLAAKTSIFSSIAAKIAIGVAAALVVVGGIVAAIVLTSGDDKNDNQSTILNPNKPGVEAQSTTKNELGENETTEKRAEEDTEDVTEESTEVINEEVEYIENTIFGANCIVYEKNQITVKDVLGEKEDLVISFDGDCETTLDYYNNSEYLIVDFKDLDRDYNFETSYIIALSRDGNIRFVSEKLECEPVINNDGNLVYVDKENNITCINLSTGEEVYKTHVSYLEDEALDIDDISGCMLKISSSYGYDNYIYNILTGELIYELAGQSGLAVNDIQYVTLIDDNFIVYDIDDGVAEIEGKREKPIKKFTTYDVNGNMVKTCEEKLYINFLASAQNNYMVVTKEMNGEYVSGIFKSDMTPILDYNTEIFALDTVYTLHDMDMVSNDEGVSYVFTKDMSYKIVYESPYRGTYFILKGADGKTYFYSMSGDELVEIANEAEKEQETWFADGIYGKTISRMKLFYEYNIETDEINFYVVDGEKVYSGIETRDEDDLDDCFAENGNYLIYLGTESALLMNYVTMQEYKIENSEVLTGTIVGVANDKYYLYYTEAEKDEKNTTYTLKAYNIETKEITVVCEKDLSTKIANYSYDDIFKATDYGFIVLNNDGTYEINKLELE